MSDFFLPAKNEISPNFNEITRYLGYKKSTPPTADIFSLIEKAVAEFQLIISPQAVYETFELKVESNGQNTIQFGDYTIKSKSLTQNLSGCSKVILFAATIGPIVDSTIRRAQANDTVYASILQATGAMFIEQTVELLNEKIKLEAEKNGTSTHPRFSPGYGDVPLETQKIFFSLLPCTRIGLTLMDTLIMAPEKSVTGFIGLK